MLVYLLVSLMLLVSDLVSGWSLLYLDNKLLVAALSLLLSYTDLSAFCLSMVSCCCLCSSSCRLFMSFNSN